MDVSLMLAVSAAAYWVGPYLYAKRLWHTDVCECGGEQLQMEAASSTSLSPLNSVLPYVKEQVAS